MRNTKKFSTKQRISLALGGLAALLSSVSCTTHLHSPGKNPRIPNFSVTDIYNGKQTNITNLSSDKTAEFIFLCPTTMESSNHYLEVIRKYKKQKNKKPLIFVFNEDPRKSGLNYGDLRPEYLKNVLIVYDSSGKIGDILAQGRNFGVTSTVRDNEIIKIDRH